MIKNYILKGSHCADCVWGEDSMYNIMCAHCVECKYTKGDSNFLTREVAELLELVKPKEVNS